MFSLLSVPQLGAYIGERVLFQRERAAGMYGPFEFVVSITICDTPLQILSTLFFTLITYELSELQGDKGFYLLTMFLVRARGGGGANPAVCPTSH
jgi:ABC-type multidrug transport system permease subunit